MSQPYVSIEEMMHWGDAFPASLFVGFVTCDWVTDSVLWHCDRKSVWPPEIEWWDVGKVISLEGATNTLHMAQLMPVPLHHHCFSKILNGLLFWCRLTQFVLEKRALNSCLSVCHPRTGADAVGCQVQMVKSNGEIFYFNNPKLLALPSSNTFAVSGHTEIRSKSAF